MEFYAQDGHFYNKREYEAIKTDLLNDYSLQIHNNAALLQNAKDCNEDISYYEQLQTELIEKYNRIEAETYSTYKKDYNKIIHDYRVKRAGERVYDVTAKIFGSLALIIYFFPVIIVVLFSLWWAIGTPGRSTSYTSSSSYGSGNSSSYSRDNTCLKSGCSRKVYGSDLYCSSHKNKTISSGSSSNSSYSYNHSSSSSIKDDPYDTYWYDDADDFAADMADEFDGYDDAYDYWEER